jgi:rod shape-determining protein MreD
MVRFALGRPNRLDRQPKKSAGLIPALSVVTGSMLSLLPVVTQLGWVPDFGFLLLLAWRLLRSDVIPAWWAAPLGLFNDLVTGSPIGLSISLWTSAMLLLDLLDRRTMWRDYWIEWALAALLLLADEAARWRVDSIMGAPLPFRVIGPPLLIAVLVFPLAAWTATRLDRWRLGR